jgi:GTP cyclohydrolase I
MITTTPEIPMHAPLTQPMENQSSMDSAEANKVLNEIINAIGEGSTDKPVIEIENRQSKGYAVCIRTFMGAAKKQVVDAVAAKHKLTVSEEAEALVLC